MNRKTINILYWIVTAIFCIANFLSGISGFFPNQQVLDLMTLLGYPAYLLIIVSTAKILGSAAIIQNKFKTIKEWAYAGFVIDYIGASASIYFVSADIIAILFPIIFLIVMFVSYFLWKKVEHMKKSEKRY